MLGFLTGAAVYGLIYLSVFPAISAIANYGNTLLANLWNVNVWLLIGLFAAMTLLLFYALERAIRPRRDRVIGGQ